MKHYGIEMEGKFYSEQLASVPGWTSDDESRVVYDQTGDKLYYGSGSEWVRIASYTEVQSAQDLPSGTYMLFAQASAPTGWTKYTGFTTASMVTFTDGTGGGEAGSDSPINWTPNIANDSHYHGDGSLQFRTMKKVEEYIGIDIVTHFKHYSSGGTETVTSRQHRWPHYSDHGASHAYYLGIDGNATYYTKAGTGNTSSTSHDHNSDAFTPRYLTVICGTKD